MIHLSALLLLPSLLLKPCRKGVSYVSIYFVPDCLADSKSVSFSACDFDVTVGVTGVDFSILLQHFIKLYGDNFLLSIKHLSEACNLSLDGEPTSQTSVPSKTLTVPINKKLTPAKFEAWKMWHEDGLTFKEIAVSHVIRILFDEPSACLLRFLHILFEYRIFLVEQ